MKSTIFIKHTGRDLFENANISTEAAQAQEPEKVSDFQLFEHFGESQHAQTTEAVLQAGLCLRRSDGKGILQKVRRPSEKEFQTAYVPCVRLRCANRTYGGLYLHRYARRETA